MENSNDLLANANLYYPEAREWMWNYCVYLGPYIDSDGTKYDLGVFINRDNTLSAAIVYGNKPGEYLSGNERDFRTSREVYEEAFKRAYILKLKQ